MSYSENAMINDYLGQVRKKLPEWLKPKKEEVKAILNNLKHQILDEARTIAGGSDPNSADIQQALIQIGSPETIANIYKKRGTPKLYITEELFEFYLRTLIFFCIVVVSINLIIAIFRFIFQPWNWLESLGAMFSGIWIGCLITAVVITILFVFFSMQGFLPEDFGVIPFKLALIFPFHLAERELQETKEHTKERLEQASERIKTIITESRAKLAGKLAEIEALKQERMAAAELRREQKLIEAKMRKEERIERARRRREQRKEIAKQKREIKKKQPVTVGQLIFGTIGGIVFGVFLIIQPFAEITGLFHIQFLDWLKLLGLLIFVSGLFNLIRLAAGIRNYTGQQVALGIQTLYNGVYIPIFLFLIDKPEIFPISLFSGGTIPIIPLDPSNTAYIIYFWVIIVIAIGIIIGMISNFYKIYKFQKLKKEY